MKRIISLVFLFAVMVNCQPTEVDVNVQWSADSEAQFYKILVWTGTDTLQTELIEDKNLADVNLANVIVYDVTPPQTSITFQSAINGEYIHVAGVIVGDLGLTSLLTVTNFQRKPNVPNKMQLLEFNLNL